MEELTATRISQEENIYLALQRGQITQEVSAKLLAMVQASFKERAKLYAEKVDKVVENEKTNEIMENNEINSTTHMMQPMVEENNQLGHVQTGVCTEVPVERSEINPEKQEMKQMEVVKNFICDFKDCDAKYTYKASLKDHLIKKHKINEDDAYEKLQMKKGKKRTSTAAFENVEIVKIEENVKEESLKLEWLKELLESSLVPHENNETLVVKSWDYPERGSLEQLRCLVPQINNLEEKLSLAEVPRVLVETVDNGSCQFDALSMQLNCGKSADSIRAEICDFMENNFNIFEPFIDPSIIAIYISKMREPKTFGGLLTLFAASYVYQRTIRLVLSVDCSDIIIPTLVHNCEELVIAHYIENHYYSTKKIPAKSSVITIKHESSSVEAVNKKITQSDVVTIDNVSIIAETVQEIDLDFQYRRTMSHSCKIPVFTVIGFNEGIGKTTSVYNLGWILAKHARVLLVDADFQCGLTQTFLGNIEDAETILLNEVDSSLNIGCAIRQSILSGKEPESVKVIQHKQHSSLFLLPGSSLLSQYEDSLNVSENNLFGNDSEKYAFWPLLFDLVVQKSAREMNANLILVDTGSNSGVLNMVILFSSDYFISPIQANRISVEGFRNLIQKFDSRNDNTFSLSWSGRMNTYYTRCNSILNESLLYKGYKFEIRSPILLGVLVGFYDVEANGKTPQQSYTNIISEISLFIEKSFSSSLIRIEDINCHIGRIPGLPSAKPSSFFNIMRNVNLPIVALDELKYHALYKNPDRRVKSDSTFLLSYFRNSFKKLQILVSAYKMFSRRILSILCPLQKIQIENFYLEIKLSSALVCNSTAVTTDSVVNSHNSTIPSPEHITDPVLVSKSVSENSFGDTSF